MADLESILPPRSTPFELAMEQVSSRLFGKVDVGSLKRMRDPFQASVSHLPFLAWGRGVDLWRDYWPEWKKRRITSEIYEMKGLKGTLPGINKYLSYMDAEIYDAVIPPIGAFAIEYSASALEEWRNQFAELRLYPYSIPGERPTFAAGSGLRLSASFAGSMFAQENGAARYYGRRATIYDQGEETEIRSFDQLRSWGSDAALDVTTFAIPADGTLADTIAGFAFVGHAYVPEKNRGRLITVGRDGTFGSGQIPSGIESVTPLNIAPERIYQKHEARFLEAFASELSKTGADYTYAYSDASVQYIFDRWRLLDNERMKIQSTGLMAPFVRHTYVGLTDYTALLRVKATYRRDGWPSYAGHAFVGMSHVGVETKRVDEVGEAIFKSRSLRDQIWFTTATYKPMSINDLSFNAGQPWHGMIPIKRTAL